VVRSRFNLAFVLPPSRLRFPVTRLSFPLARRRSCYEAVSPFPDPWYRELDPVPLCSNVFFWFSALGMRLVLSAGSVFSSPVLACRTVTNFLLRS
jgi:hypothetical protein